VVSAIVFLALHVRDRADLSDDDTKREKRQQARARFIRLVFFTLFLIYSATSHQLLGTFVCHPVDNKAYIASDFKVECYTTHWKHQLAWVVPCACIYVAGVPLLFFVVLQQNATYFHDYYVWLKLGFIYDGLLQFCDLHLTPLGINPTLSLVLSGLHRLSWFLQYSVHVLICGLDKMFCSVSSTNLVVGTGKRVFYACIS
jgi:hypothetical protein